MREKNFYCCAKRIYNVCAKRISWKIYTIYLISGLTEQSELDQEKAKTIKSEIVSHWHPNLTLNLGSFTSIQIVNYSSKTGYLNNQPRLGYINWKFKIWKKSVLAGNNIHTSFWEKKSNSLKLHLSCKFIAGSNPAITSKLQKPI